MARNKTHITITHIEAVYTAEDTLTEDPPRTVIVADANVPDQPGALKWVKEHGEEGVEYAFFRAVRSVTKTVKKTVVLVDG